MCMRAGSGGHVIALRQTYPHLNPVNPNSAACRKPPMPVRKFTAPDPSAFSVHTCTWQVGWCPDSQDMGPHEAAAPAPKGRARGQAGVTRDLTLL